MRNRKGFVTPAMVINKQMSVDKEKERTQKTNQVEIASSKWWERATLKRNREYEEALKRCSVEGVSCEFGICDECPNTRSVQ